MNKFDLGQEFTQFPPFELAQFYRLRQWLSAESDGPPAGTRDRKPPGDVRENTEHIRFGGHRITEGAMAGATGSDVTPRFFTSRICRVCV
jgi:hypothetical protein